MHENIRKGILTFNSNNNNIKLADHLELISKYKIIHFDYEFNQPIDMLENFDITELMFGGGDHYRMYPISHFNQQVDNLPSTLTKLYFNSDSSFNHPINFLPTGLTFLSLGSDFNQPIDYLPAKLKYLCICSKNNFFFYVFSVVKTCKTIHPSITSQIPR